MRDERFGNAMGAKRGDDRRNVAVLAGVVVSKEPYRVREAEVVVEEASEEGTCLVIAEGFLTGPGCVVFGEPEEVVVVQVYACADEGARMSAGLKNPDLMIRT
jgi:hypothetical protein